MNKVTVGVITVAAVAAAGLGVGAVDRALDPTSDPRESVSGITVEGVDATMGADRDDGTTPSAGAQRVAALDRLDGVLERRGDDPDDFHIGAVELDFGPDSWVVTAGPSEDFDGNGTADALLDELDGLLGQQVTAHVRLDDDGDDGDVYIFNDLDYRDTAGGDPPWQPAGVSTDAEVTTEEIGAAAVGAVGTGARLDDLDRENAGEVAWEAEVNDADGREHTVLLDAGGEVLDVRVDD